MTRPAQLPCLIVWRRRKIIHLCLLFTSCVVTGSCMARDATLYIVLGHLTVQSSSLFYLKDFHGSTVDQMTHRKQAKVHQAHTILSRYKQAIVPLSSKQQRNYDVFGCSLKFCMDRTNFVCHVFRFFFLRNLSCV
jgi:hypothetical protein